MRRTAFSAIAVAIGLYTAVPAHATVLTPGSGLQASSIVSVSAGSTLLASETESGTDTSTGLTVSVLQQVWKDSVTGGLDFVYVVKNTGTQDFIDTVTAGNFKALGAGPINVGANGAGNVPVLVSWSSDSSAVKWFFSNTTDNDITPGQSSQTLVIMTKATSFTTGTFTVQDTGVVPLVCYQPGPEPSTTVLAGLGALGLIGYGLRRRKAKSA